ncbi:hypothetical protein NPIL_238551 [Nephila pilipes]|uniref:Uncharacterized protein n=1 Tax=Nephila pilipes TaxID=299642 RepID=A0A8X6TP31_NEPPI|nr:hypothetical protein NPIL_238551 [Nephila pilipes]
MGGKRISARSPSNIINSSKSSNSDECNTNPYINSNIHQTINLPISDKTNLMSQESVAAPILSESVHCGSDPIYEVPDGQAALASTEVPPAMDLNLILDPYPYPELSVGSSLVPSFMPELDLRMPSSPGPIYDPSSDLADRDFNDLISLVEAFDGSGCVPLRLERRWSGGCLPSVPLRPAPLMISCPNTFAPGFSSAAAFFAPRMMAPISNL